MRDYLANEVRNIVLLGHSGSGKTSVVEAALYLTKELDRMGKGSDGTLSLDFDAEESKRKLSIFMSLAPIEWKNCKINFIDTPGYLDYESEQRVGIAIGDSALIVVSGKDGVEAGVEKAFKAVTKTNKPAIFFINKIDEENASFENTYNSLRDKFGKTVIPFEVPIVENGKVSGSVNILRKKAWYYNDRENAKEVPSELRDLVDEYYNQIAESIAMTDDELMEKFFSGEVFDEHELAKGLRIGVRNGDIKPVYCGSAISCTGIERLLDLITEYLPSYAEKGLVHAKNDKGEDLSLETNEKEILSALVVKTIVDPFVGRISFVKVKSGVLTTDSTVYNSVTEENEKINQIFVIKGKNQIAVGKLFTGDIGAVIKLQHTNTNDTLCKKEKPVILDKIDFPKPMLGFALWPKTKADEDKMSFAIQRLLEEDPSLIFDKNAETNEQVLYALGDQMVDVIVNKLKSKYKVEVDLTIPKVQYRETITTSVVAEGKHKKQTGGAGQFGHVFVRFEPSDSEDMTFGSEVVGGAVPKGFFPAVEAGLRESMTKGVLAGYKVVGVRCVLTDGSYHDVDSKEVAFKAAAKLAYKAGMVKAKPILLEPIGKVNAVIPEEYTGTIIGDFNKRRGLILGMTLNEDNDQEIIAEVPMAEMQKYATELRSMTQGKGTFVIEFDRYEPAQKPVADKVIASRLKELEKE